MVDLRLTFAAAKGELDAAIKAKYQPIAAAATAAIRDVAKAVKSEGRADIEPALGKRFANALRVNVYPSGKAVSAEAAAYIFHRIPYAAIFEDGGRIAGRPLLWLPLPSAPARIGRQRITPALYRQRIGKLRLLRRPGRRPLLVADIKIGRRTAAAGRTKFSVATLQRQASKSAKGVRRSIPMFVGLSTADIRQRIHVRRIAQHQRDRLPGLYFAHLDPDA